jgi:MFS family permease
MIALSCLGLEVSLLGGPLVLPYAAWVLGGAGMGIVYPTLGIVSMEWGGPGREGTATAAIQLSSVLGLALGAGLGGAAVALAYVRGAPLGVGLAAAFGMCLVAALATVAVSTRLRPAAA